MRIPLAVLISCVLLVHCVAMDGEGMLVESDLLDVRTAEPTLDLGYATKSNQTQMGDSEVLAWDPVSAQDLDTSLDWLDSVKVGYDKGFVIASAREENLNTRRSPFQLRLNGWGQLRHTISEVEGTNRDLNQFQLKRGRLVFSGSAFSEDFDYYVQLDGRSSSGDDIRLLDYYLSYDFGRRSLGLRPGTLGFRTGKYKMPFHRARWLSGRQLEFADRSMASTFFDVNRSFAWGLFGHNHALGLPLDWEMAIFNGLVTGGAETGSSGSLDDNFAYSSRVSLDLFGKWGSGQLADFDGHESPAIRFGAGFATSTIDRSGSTEFSSIRIVDSGRTLSSLLPSTIESYSVSLYAVDASVKFRGWSSTIEYYFRTVGNSVGASYLPELMDHGLWYQLACFVIPRKLQLLTRWSRVQGDSGTLGAMDQSAEEIAAGFAWYFNENHAKLVTDVTSMDGAPINSQALDIVPGDDGWLVRSQIQFSF